MTVSCKDGGALSFTEAGTESIIVTCSSVEVNVLLLSVKACFSVIFCSFTTAGAGAAFALSEGPSSSVMSSWSSVEDEVEEAGEEGCSSWACVFAGFDGVVGFCALVILLCGYNAKIRNR